MRPFGKNYVCHTFFLLKTMQLKLLLVLQLRLEILEAHFRIFVDDDDDDDDNDYYDVDDDDDALQWVYVYKKGYCPLLDFQVVQVFPFVNTIFIQFQSQTKVIG